jgi:hypothetical protein
MTTVGVVSAKIPLVAGETVSELAPHLPTQLPKCVEAICRPQV